MKEGILKYFSLIDNFLQGARIVGAAEPAASASIALWIVILGAEE